MHIMLRGIVRAGIEGAAVALAMVAAFLVRFDGVIPSERATQVVWAVALALVFKGVGLRVAGLHRHSWQYVTLGDMVEVTRVLVAASGVFVVLRLAVGAGPGAIVPVGLPLGVIVADLALSLVVLTSIRVARRRQAERHRPRGVVEDRPRRALLIGAGHAGVMMLRDLRHGSGGRIQPVAFLDDDPSKAGRRVAGLDVVGTVDDLAEVARLHRVDTAIITIARASGSDVRRILAACEGVGLATKIVPTLAEIVHGDVRVSRIRDVAVEDLLGRDQVALDDHEARALVRGRRILVTGAGGSIGSELVRQAARLGADQLLLVERSEPALWAIHREVESAHPGLQVVPLIADVTDRPRMHAIFANHAPDVVVHAAAHKHVPMMEHNPGEAVKNNVGGTRVVTDLAAAHGVQRFVLVSTDKAVRPTSVMGATKRLCERYVQHVAVTTGLHAVSVRFGNVLASQGSVVPIFEQQVRDGGPLTVTHPDVTRFFMTIPEASQLVLEAAAIGQPGEILVLDMGEPVRIADLADAVIRLSGLEPGRDIRVEYTGLRPGEKLYEELALAEEGITRTRHPKIWIGQGARLTWPSVTADLVLLRDATNLAEAAAVRRALRMVVPEYTGASVDVPTPAPAAALVDAA